jgi:hypothetical protein
MYNDSNFLTKALYTNNRRINRNNIKKQLKYKMKSTATLFCIVIASVVTTNNCLAKNNNNNNTKNQKIQLAITTNIGVLEWRAFGLPFSSTLLVKF